MCKRNATASWSGFSHQGQVGLLVAIRKIKENGVDLTNHFLEYEKREDIAICKRVGGTEEYLSVHQVKAYYSKGHLFSSYESVFKGLVEYQRDENGKLVKDPNGNKQPTGSFIPGDWCDADNYLHSVEAISDWTDEKLAQIGNNHNIKRFEYSPGVFHCDTVNIATLIRDELLPILNNDQNRAKQAHMKLTYHLDEKIRSEHKKGEKVLYDIQFPLEELNGIINDASEFQSEAIHNIRHAFYNEFFERLKNEDHDEEHIKDVEREIIDRIYQLDDNEFLLFLKRLHFDENPENLENTAFLFNQHGVRYVFFKALLEILMTFPIYENNYVQYFKEGVSDRFLLTAISRMPGEEKAVVENILRNTELQNILWDRHALINQNLEGGLTVLNPNIMNAGTNGEQSGKFMSFTENTRLIKIDDAKQKLN